MFETVGFVPLALANLSLLRIVLSAAASSATPTSRRAGETIE